MEAELIGFTQITELLSQQLGKSCQVEGYYQDSQTEMQLLKVKVGEDWKWFTHGEESYFQEIDYEINYWTVCWLTNDDYEEDEE